MNSIQCTVVKNGVRCSLTFETNDPVAPNARYICSKKDADGRDLHTRADQVRAADRPYDPVADEADKDLHFQDCQHDPDLRRGAHPQGTSHISHQGSEPRASIRRDDE